jgi:hypothetical protein
VEIAQESGYWPMENQSSRGQGNRDTVSLETPGRSEPSVQRDRCRRSGASRHISNREIGVPKDKIIETSKVSKSWRKSRPSIREGTRGGDRCSIGRGDGKESIHR